jgi:zona occludens toxin (predicted ATPase)
MNKHFLNKNSSLFEIPKVRLLIGILIGLAYSISFYSLLYLFRETIRVFSASLTNVIWILSNDEVNNPS